MGSCAAYVPTSEWPKVPLRVLKAAQKAGGHSEVYKAPGENMWLVKCSHGDSVYGVMDEWISGLHLGADPFVNVQFTPAFKLVGTALCPPDAAQFNLLREASSVVYHYAPLTRESFVEPLAQPPIPGPLKGNAANVFVHHAKVALTAIHYRIQHMNEANYPILSGLPQGSYICTVNIGWSNAIQAVTLFKP